MPNPFFEIFRFLILVIFSSLHPGVVSLSSKLPSSSFTLSSSSSSPSPSDGVIKNVAIVGGTHGNEYTGVWVVKAWETNRHKQNQKFPSLKIQTLVGNPEAHLANKRFIDADLNREFTKSKLVTDHQNDYEEYGEDMHSSSVESLRAREINELLGPKFGSEDANKCDLIIDLHSTTSNMGITIIIPEGDAIMSKAAAYVMYQINQKHEEVTSCQILMHSIALREQRPNLSSISKHGFTIEVGPVPQGVLRHDAVENTELAIRYLLEFLEKRLNDDGVGDDCFWNELATEYDGQVPCYRTIQPKFGTENQNSMSSKIAWPTDPKFNPNFPSWMIHKSIQDCDFTKVVRTGDPLFVKMDGSIVKYDGSFGDEVYLIFINEGGYYYKSSGTGIGVAIQATYNLQTGMIKNDEHSIIKQ